MYIFLILFFASLISITFMVVRKLLLLQSGQIAGNTEVPFKIPHLEKVKYFTITNIKKYEHLLLVEILRFYVRSINFLKNKYQEVKIKIKNRISKKYATGEKKEMSKFLKIMGDYKRKIRDIKHRIKKEENL